MAEALGSEQDKRAFFADVEKLLKDPYTGRPLCYTCAASIFMRYAKQYCKFYGFMRESSCPGCQHRNPDTPPTSLWIGEMGASMIDANALAPYFGFWMMLCSRCLPPGSEFLFKTINQNASEMSFKATQAYCAASVTTKELCRYTIASCDIATHPSGHFLHAGLHRQSTSEACKQPIGRKPSAGTVLDETNYPHAAIVCKDPRCRKVFCPLFVHEELSYDKTYERVFMPLINRCLVYVLRQGKDVLPQVLVERIFMSGRSLGFRLSDPYLSHPRVCMAVIIFVMMQNRDQVGYSSTVAKFIKAMSSVVRSALRLRFLGTACDLPEFASLVAWYRRPGKPHEAIKHILAPEQVEMGRPVLPRMKRSDPWNASMDESIVLSLLHRRAVVSKVDKPTVAAVHAERFPPYLVEICQLYNLASTSKLRLMSADAELLDYFFKTRLTGINTMIATISCVRDIQRAPSPLSPSSLERIALLAKERALGLRSQILTTSLGSSGDSFVALPRGTPPAVPVQVKQPTPPSPAPSTPAEPKPSPEVIVIEDEEDDDQDKDKDEDVTLVSAAAEEAPDSPPGGDDAESPSPVMGRPKDADRYPPLPDVQHPSESKHACPRKDYRGGYCGVCRTFYWSNASKVALEEVFRGMDLPPESDSALSIEVIHEAFRRFMRGPWMAELPASRTPDLVIFKNYVRQWWMTANRLHAEEDKGKGPMHPEEENGESSSGSDTEDDEQAVAERAKSMRMSTGGDEEDEDDERDEEPESFAAGCSGDYDYEDDDYDSEVVYGDSEDDYDSDEPMLRIVDDLSDSDDDRRN